MHTDLCEQFGIEYPIFAFTHCRDVVAAVSKAGGLGVLGAVGFSPEQLDVELAWIDEHVDGKPYGVDTVIPVKYVGKESGDLSKETLEKHVPDAHKRFIQDLLTRYEVPELPQNVERTESLLGWSASGGRASRPARRPRVSGPGSGFPTPEVPELTSWSREGGDLHEKASGDGCDCGGSRRVRGLRVRRRLPPGGRTHLLGLPRHARESAARIPTGWYW